MNLLNNPLVTAMITLPLVILAKNILGALHSGQTNDFNADYLKRGIYKGASIYFAIVVLVLVAYLNQGMSIDINGSTVTIVQGINLVIGGSIAIHLYDVFELLLSIFKQKTTE